MPSIQGDSGYSPIEQQQRFEDLKKTDQKSDLDELRGDESSGGIADKMMDADGDEAVALAKEFAGYIDDNNGESFESLATTSAAMTASLDSKIADAEAKTDGLRIKMQNTGVMPEEWDTNEKTSDLFGERTEIIKQKAEYSDAKNELNNALDSKLSPEGMDKVSSMVEGYAANISEAGNLTGIVQDQEPDTTLGKGAYDMQNATPAGTKNVVGQLNLQKGDNVHTACAMKAVLSGKIGDQLRENGKLSSEMKVVDGKVDDLKGKLEEVDKELNLVNEILEASEDGVNEDDIVARDRLASESFKLGNDISGLDKEGEKLLSQKKEGTENLKVMGEAMDSLDGKIEESGTKLDTSAITSDYKKNLKDTGNIEGKKEESPLKGRVKNFTSQVGKLLKESGGDPAIQHLAKKMGPALLKALLTTLISLPLFALLGPFGFLAAGKNLASTLKGLDNSFKQTTAEQKKMGLNPLGSLMGRIKKMGGDVKAAKEAEAIPEDEYEKEDSEGIFDRLKEFDTSTAENKDYEALSKEIGDDNKDSNLQEARELIGNILSEDREDTKADVAAFKSFQANLSADSSTTAAKTDTVVSKSISTKSSDV